MIVRAITNMPRLMTIPGLDIVAYRKLQAGETVDVPDESANNLIDRKIAIAPEVAAAAKEEEAS